MPEFGIYAGLFIVTKMVDDKLHVGHFTMVAAEANIDDAVENFRNAIQFHLEGPDNDFFDGVERIYLDDIGEIDLTFLVNYAPVTLGYWERESKESGASREIACSLPFDYDAQGTTVYGWGAKSEAEADAREHKKPFFTRDDRGRLVATPEEKDEDHGN